MMRRPRVLEVTIGWGLITLLGCSTDARQPGFAGSEERDSAGILIVENSRDLVAEAPDLRLEEELRIGAIDGSPVEEFFGLMDLAVNEDGEIYALDAGSRSVRVFSPDGAHVLEFGGPGQGHLLGQARLGPARLAHCMRWIGQAETALEMMVERSLNRFAHGSLLAEKQGIQWMIADSTMELYQSKLMVLHAAYKIDRGDDFKSEVSMAKHFVANALGRIIDRAIQVHGALGYSTDTPLSKMATQARWARFADGADEVHQWRIAQRTIDSWVRTGSMKAATGGLPL